MRWIPAALSLAAFASAQADRFATAQWDVTVTRPDVSLRGVCVVDDRIVWASGSRGTVLRSSDGGATFALVGPAENVRGTVLPSSDGGATFSAVGPAATSALDFRDIEAFDGERALVCSTTAPARVYATADGGRSWRIVHEDARQGAFFDAMAFFDEKRGLLFGDPLEGRLQLFATADGGATWQPVTAPTWPAPRDGEAAFAASGTCVRTDGARGVWIATGGVQGRALRSTDGGASWSCEELPVAAGRASTGAFSIAALPGGRAVVVGGDYENPAVGSGTAAVRAADGSWAAADALGYRSGVVALRDGMHCIAVGAAGASVSRDGGASWQPFGDAGFHAIAAGGSAGDTVVAVGSGGRVGRLRWSAAPQSEQAQPQQAQPQRTTSDLRLHGLFCDHMVLPQSTTVPVPGHAAPGADVAIEAPWLDNKAVHATAAADGRFAAQLPTPTAGGPFRLAVRSGDRTIELADVLVGDVWLGSGQSNMEMPVGPCSWSGGVTDWQRELADAEVPFLRLFTVAHRPAATPQDELDGLGSWQVCTKDTAAAFSATAFFFARALQRQRKQPLGMVVSCWGGTVCEAWTSAQGLRDFAEFAPALARLHDSTPEQAQRDRAAFWDAVRQGDPVVGARRPEAGDFDDAAWATATVPQRWRDAGLGAYDGALWYRRSVDVPAAWAGRDLLLQLGPIDDMDTVWFAGERVGGAEEPGHWQEPRSYRIRGALVRAGRAAIAVRVVDTGGEGGFTGSAEAMRLSPADGDGGGLELGGAWRCARGAELAALPAWPQPLANRPNEPSVLWNGMVAPLRSFPFRGAIWYQGESNRERAEQYGRLFPAMIRDWRAALGRGLPFLFVQIAPFGYGGDHGELFQLRRAQEQALALPATGMAPSTDVGDAADIHPLQKRPLGERLAALALARAYGRSDVACEPPRPAHVVRDGSALRLTFAPAAGGMRAPAAGPAHFELAGDDGTFHAARARLDGDDVVLQCDAVPVPRGVRYCHAAAAIGDLINGAGWPVVPFEMELPR